MVRQCDVNAQSSLIYPLKAASGEPPLTKSSSLCTTRLIIICRGNNL